MQNLILRLMEASSISDSIGNISKKWKNSQNDNILGIEIMQDSLR